jgi:DNA-binding transcriptional LysR family regulator
MSFLTVTRLGNPSAAATELPITQPALTKRLQQLEFEFGAPLLKRHSRGVSLTEQGVQVLYHAHCIQRDYLQAFEKVRALQDNHSQTLRIVSGPFFVPSSGASAD